MVSIIDAIINLLNKPVFELNKEYVNERNRANNMGEALEEYVKDLFVGTIDLEDAGKRLERFQDIFSYVGNQNNPPDFMIKGGDAVEVKKVENPFKVFEYVYTRDFDFDFNFMAIINEKKWNSLSRTQELKDLIKVKENAKLIEAKIKDPDNPAKLRNVYVVTYKIKERKN